MASRSKHKAQEKARKDIQTLFELAHTVEQSLADRYVERARKMAETHRLSLRQYNRQHCHKCLAFFTSKTLRVRTQPTTVNYECLRCGYIRRIRKTTVKK